MPNEDLIYRIAQAVHHKLGHSVDPSVVEDLVIDIYHAVHPIASPELEDFTPNDSSPTLEIAPPSTTRAVISVFGQDRPGIIAAITRILAEVNCNIVDINPTVLRGKFAMLLITDLSHLRGTLGSLQERLKEESKPLGVKAYIQREDLFHAMHRV